MIQQCYADDKMIATQWQCQRQCTQHTMPQYFAISSHSIVLIHSVWFDFYQPCLETFSEANHFYTSCCWQFRNKFFHFFQRSEWYSSKFSSCSSHIWGSHNLKVDWLSSNQVTWWLMINQGKSSNPSWNYIILLKEGQEVAKRGSAKSIDTLIKVISVLRCILTNYQHEGEAEWKRPLYTCQHKLFGTKHKYNTFSNIKQ